MSLSKKHGLESREHVKYQHLYMSGYAVFADLQRAWVTAGVAQPQTILKLLPDILSDHG